MRLFKFLIMQGDKQIKGQAFAKDKGDLLELTQADEIVWMHGVFPKNIDSIMIAQRIKLSQISEMCFMLSRLIDAGMPIDKALKGYSDNIKASVFQNMVKRIAYDIGLGSGVAQAFQEFAQYLPSQLIMALHACDHSGNYGLVFGNMGQYFKKYHDFKNRNIQIFIYPMVLWVMFTLMALGLKFVLEPLAAQVNAPITHVDIWYGVMIGFSSILAVMLAMTITGGRFNNWRLINILPVWGTIHKMQVNYNIVLNLSYLLECGVALHSALREIGTRNENKSVRRYIMQCCDNIEQGQLLSQAMPRNVFLSFIPDMIVVGEMSNSIAQMCGNVSQIIDEDLQKKYTYIVTISKYSLLLLSGVVLMGLALTVFAPLYSGSFLL